MAGRAKGLDFETYIAPSALILSPIAVAAPHDSENFIAPSAPKPPTPIPKIAALNWAKLRSQLSGQFGTRLQSTGDKQDSEQTRIIMQTLDVSPENPCMVSFKQFILDPFTGPGQFDLVERDSSDVVDGASQVIIATKSGFTDGVTTGSWSHLEKPIMNDKVFSVVFVPGTAGDGMFSISAWALYPIPGDQ